MDAGDNLFVVWDNDTRASAMTASFISGAQRVLPSASSAICRARIKWRSRHPILPRLAAVRIV
jgi:hypothetical protein